MRKSVFSLLLAPVFFSSCISYQYARLESNLPKNEAGEMVIENDSLSIRFRADGYGCPVVITVYNKLSVPLYVDWSRSAIITADGMSITLLDESAHLDATALTFQSPSTTVNPPNVNVTSVTAVDGTIVKAPYRSFVAPKAFVTGKEIYLVGHMYDLPRRDQLSRTHDGFRGVTYDRANSPTRFRCYLTLSVNSDFSSPFHYDQEFWVSEVGRMRGRPNQAYAQPRDRFYLANAAGLGAGLAIFGILGLVYHHWMSEYSQFP